MILAKVFSLALASALLISNSALGATILQTTGTFVAFNAEIGTIDDGPADGTKFDVMAPAGGSFSNYLSVESLGATVSFDVDFLDTAEYTVYVRYRELVNNTPNIELTFNGVSKVSSVFVTPPPASTPNQFVWTHLSNSDFTPTNTPGVPETVTLRAIAGSDFEIDAVALVNRVIVNSPSFDVNDVTIPESALAIPEPSSVAFLLTGPLLLLRRRRS